MASYPASYPLTRKHVVITGASDGIGRALASEVARCGARVTLAARSREKLIAVAVADEASCRALSEQAIAQQGEIDVLVCNAGIGSASQGDELIPVAAIKKIVDVNFMGAVYTTAAALPSLRKTRGLIVAVSSLQGLFAFPRASGYSASTHAMQGFFDSLRLDLEGAVDVLVVSPGPVATTIHLGQAPRSQALTMTKVESRSMPVDTCARLIRAAIEARRRDLVMTFAGRLAARLYPFVPGFVDKQVLRAARRFYS